MENKDVIDILSSVDTKIQNLSTSIAGQFKEIKEEIGHLKDKIDVSVHETGAMKVTQSSCMKTLAEDKLKWDEAYKDTTLIRAARKNPKAIIAGFAIIVYLGGPEWLSKIGQLISSINF